ncbi:substrate-binding domain-containing protein [Tunicatimonas pelagia]|uniref:substrate-binding domain-containing protein n=1 Tax=Tunicatimonas pelagia TaxID=931531 RepID=UPI002666A66B|nr:substrate-binding domain-containing protein [Tunicatimonas pelagia]WKN42458.1 substrate-binding domain-containing protein [Tunicatimonas pelagia]
MDQFNVGSVPEHFMLPWHLAIENGDFQAHGLSVNWQDYPGGTGAMMADLHDGQLDIAIALTEGVIADIVKQRASKLVQVFISSPLTWGIHVAANSAYQSVEELASATFAISRMGSGSHLMAVVMAKHRGWPLDKMQLKVVGGMEGARQALPGGEADAFMWEKYMTQPIVEQGDFRRVGEFDTPWPCFVVVVRNEVLQSSLAQVEVLLKIAQQSAKSFTSRDDATTLVAQRYGLTYEDAESWFGRTKWQTNFRVSRAMLEQVMNALMNCQIIDQKVEPHQLCSSLTVLEQ